MELFILFLAVHKYEFTFKIVTTVRGRWYHIVRPISRRSFDRRKLGIALFYNVVQIFIDIPFEYRVEEGEV